MVWHESIADEGLGWLVDPLLDRIAERRALLTEQARRLGKELAEVEAELERVSSAEQVVAQLLAEQDDWAEEEAGDGGVGQDSRQGGGRGPTAPPRPALAVPHRGEGAGVDDLPADYQRVMAVVAEEGPVGQGVACKTSQGLGCQAASVSVGCDQAVVSA